MQFNDDALLPRLRTGARCNKIRHQGLLYDVTRHDRSASPTPLAFVIAVNSFFPLCECFVFVHIPY